MMGKYEIFVQPALGIGIGTAGGRIFEEMVTHFDLAGGIRGPFASELGLAAHAKNHGMFILIANNPPELQL